MLAFAVSFVGLFKFIGDLGVGVSHSKNVNDKNLDEGKCNGALITIKLVLNILMVLSILTTIFVLKIFFDYRFESEILELLVYLVIIKVFIDNLISNSMIQIFFFYNENINMFLVGI